MNRISISILLATLCLCSLTAAAYHGPDNGETVPAERITVSDLQHRLTDKARIVIIDVRGSDYDTSDSKIQGAIRIAPGDIKQHLGDLPHDREIVTYCSCPTDGGALSAARVLRENGFKNVHALKGGWPAWVKAGGPVEPK
ncbi:MAG: rhodanese-like domain-containing protein [Blastocatellia bacterium]